MVPVAYLRRNNLIDSEQRALAKVGFLRVGIGVSSRRFGGFAIEVGGIVITATINDLSSKTSEQRLCTFRAVDHVELALRLRADDALLDMVVLSDKTVQTRVLNRS
jgi:hypothetical protein